LPKEIDLLFEPGNPLLPPGVNGKEGRQQTEDSGEERVRESISNAKLAMQVVS